MNYLPFVKIKRIKIKDPRAVILVQNTTQRVVLSITLS